MMTSLLYQDQPDWEKANSYHFSPPIKRFIIKSQSVTAFAWNFFTSSVIRQILILYNLVCFFNAKHSFQLLNLTKILQLLKFFLSKEFFLKYYTFQQILLIPYNSLGVPGLMSFTLLCCVNLKLNAVTRQAMTIFGLEPAWCINLFAAPCQANQISTSNRGRRISMATFWCKNSR